MGREGGGPSEQGPRSAAPAQTKVEDLFNGASPDFGDNCLGQSELTQSRAEGRIGGGWGAGSWEGKGAFPPPLRRLATATK